MNIMKIFYTLTAVAVMLVAASCNGDRKASAASDNAAPRQEQVGDTARHTNATPAVTPGAINAPTVNRATNEVIADKTLLKAETPADRLVKQYGETLVDLIQASKAGKPNEAAAQKFENLKKQLEELDKAGKLNSNQKDLFKATNDAYNKLNK